MWNRRDMLAILASLLCTTPALFSSFVLLPIQGAGALDMSSGWWAPPIPSPPAPFPLSATPISFLFSRMPSPVLSNLFVIQSSSLSLGGVQWASGTCWAYADAKLAPALILCCHRHALQHICDTGSRVPNQQQKS